MEFVGPQVGRELAENGALALLVTSLGIVMYLALRFEWKFGVAAIIANLHDVVIILGFFAFFQWEFSLPVLAAMLAMLGYSVNESVVVADRIRENFRKMRKASVTQIIDNAITRTMSRTIITHGCTQAMVLSMLLFGGAALHYFARGAHHRHPVRHLLLGAGHGAASCAGWACSAKTWSSRCGTARKKRSSRQSLVEFPNRHPPASGCLE